MFRGSIALSARKVDTLGTEKPRGSPVEKIAFLHSWMLFGLLESFAPLRDSLKTCNVVSVRNDCQLLALPFPAKYMSKWEILGRDRDADTRDRQIW